MRQVELFSKEVVDKVGETVGRQSTQEKVEQFVKHGNLFLFFEIMDLKQQLVELERQIQTAQKGK